MVFHRSLVNWSWYISPMYMCILLYVTHIQCSGISQISHQLELGGLGICAFCYMGNFYGVKVFHRSMVNWRGYICPKYMCILLYVTHIQCSGISQISQQLELGGLGICAFSYMGNFCGVEVFQRSMVNFEGCYVCPKCMCILLYVKLIWCHGIPQIYFQLQKGGALVYVHSAIHETSVVQQHSIHLWSNGWGYICPRYMCIPPICYTYSVQWYSIDLWLIVGGGLGICAFCYMLNFCGVVVFLTCMVNWSRVDLP